MRCGNESPVGSSNVDISSDSSMVIIGVQVALYHKKFTHEPSEVFRDEYSPTKC